MRAFRSFALVAILWTSGRAIVLSGPDHGSSVGRLTVSSMSEPSISNATKLAGQKDLLSQAKSRVRSPLRLQKPAIVTAWMIDTPVAIKEIIQAQQALNLIPRGDVAAPTTLPSQAESLVRSDIAKALSSVSLSTSLRPNSFATFSGYLFVRGSSQQPGLSGSAVLGGSQMAIFANGPQIAEVGGLVIQPFARLASDGRQITPQELTFGVTAGKRKANFTYSASLERRAKIENGGRDAFAARATVGLYTRIDPTPLTFSGYGQAGIVGISQKDGFAEGEAILSFTEGDRFRLAKPGIAVWAAIQPGAARIDIGPTLEVPLLRGPVPVVARTSWRFRVGGNALPGSGPALIVVTGF